MSAELVAGIGAVLLAYPVIAGMVYRVIAPHVPPEPVPCDGSGRTRGGSYCRPRQWLSIDIKYPTLHCEKCQEWNTWAHTYRRRARMCAALASLWPILLVTHLPRRLFAVGANVRAVGSGE